MDTLKTEIRHQVSLWQMAEKLGGFEEVFKDQVKCARSTRRTPPFWQAGKRT